MSVTNDVEQFILTELGLGDELDAVPPDEDLLASGIIDSHGLAQLIAFLRERYAIVVADGDLKPENFQTLNSIEAFVARERS